MFPDPTIHWKPYPSVIDGIGRPPFVLDRGVWRGVLRLTVESPSDGPAYGIEISADIHAGFDELIYSISDHGTSDSYDGTVYVKEAIDSAPLRANAALGLPGRPLRHFLFVGGEYCYEVLGSSEPVIHAFVDGDAARTWALSAQQEG